MTEDPCSQANLSHFRTSHLDWNVQVNFSTKLLTCIAKLTTRCVEPADTLILDSSDLQIRSVHIGDSSVPFQLGAENKPFGQALEISVPVACNVQGAEFVVSIEYDTSPEASALQWLSPEQTLGKKHPYLFTQCQAIHARSIVPCQDSPSNKITYDAQVTVDTTMVALMSAVKGEEQITDQKKTCFFQQKINIPSYLIALAVGDLESRTVGKHSKVWCEREMVDRCAYEFTCVDEQLAAAEQLMGPYVWGDYDLLILPPSFPYGGMENPCLTFVTPTLVVGDRSLTSVVVHEITHSWTGNLVTNANWEHFWLNEGFTRFCEAKIVGRLDGEASRHFSMISGWSHLIDAVKKFGADSPLTKLVPRLRNVDPDDAFSSVPYENGCAFLFYLESLVGGAQAFEPFLKSYINHFKYKTLVTEDFKCYLLEHFKDKQHSLDQVDWEAWLYSTGMPPVNVIDMFDTTLTDACSHLCNRWLTDPTGEFTAEEFNSFTTQQMIHFLAKLFEDGALPLERLKRMADLYDLCSSKNAEIQFAFYRLCIHAEWTELTDDITAFVTTQGRMKFVRPLYREMGNGGMREIAVQTFQNNRHIYHKIAAKMVAQDLNIVY